MILSVCHPWVKDKGLAVGGDWGSTQSCRDFGLNVIACLESIPSIAGDMGLGHSLLWLWTSEG